MFSNVVSLKIPLRFALLRHEMPPHSVRASHFDLLLEYEGILLSWVLYSPLYSGLRTVGYANRDHRIDYLDYNGPLSNDRGAVTQALAGEIEWMSKVPGMVAAGLKTERNRWNLVLQKLHPEQHDDPVTDGSLGGPWLLEVNDAPQIPQSG